MSAERSEIGLVHIYHEPGEVRDFLPEFVEGLVESGWNVGINKNYGIGMGLTDKDYTSTGVIACNDKQILSYPYHLTLRYNDPYVKSLKSGTTLIAMLHWDTRPDRVKYFKDNGINGIALDLIRDDDRKRLVENLALVARNGINSGFSALEKYSPEIVDSKKVIKVTIIGNGNIGLSAVHEAVHYEKAPVIAQVIGRNITSDKKLLTEILSDSDMLVDATNRKGSSTAIITNEMLGNTPEHCVVVDLCVDPYVIKNGVIIANKGIEGIPQGNLDKFIIGVDDPEWDNTIPHEVDHRTKRTTVSCYSWPGVTPEDSMRIYGKQLLPLLKALKEVGGYENLSEDNDNPLVRALYRGTLDYQLR